MDTDNWRCANWKMIRLSQVMVFYQNNSQIFAIIHHLFMRKFSA